MTEKKTIETHYCCNCNKDQKMILIEKEYDEDCECMTYYFKCVECDSVEHLYE